MKEIANRLNTSIGTVNRRLKDAPPKTNYYQMLVRQCVLDLKRGDTCYCFTEEQLADIRSLYPHFTYTIKEGVYVIERT